MAGLELAPLLAKVKVDLKGFRSEMEQVKKIGVSETASLSEKLQSAGGKVNKIGSALTLGVTTPIVGIGTAVTKMAMDFETNFAKVSTLLDENSVDYDKYKQDLIKASSESKVAVGEFSEAVYSSISAGVDQTKAIEFTAEAMKLAKGGFTSGAAAVDILTTAINGYGLSASDATELADMLITTQNLGKTTVDELASSMGKVIPIAAASNFSMQELSTTYAVLTKNGIATAEAGTYTRSMLSELSKAGSGVDKVLRELTEKGFAELKKEGKSTSEILQTLNQYAIDNGVSIKDLFSSVEAGSAALVLAKDDAKEYTEILEAMGDSAGATQTAFNKMDGTKAAKISDLLNRVKNNGIRLGEKLLPLAEKLLGKVEGFVDWLTKLDDKQLEQIVTWGGVAAAAGPVLKLFGGGISTIGKLAGAFKGFGGVAGGLGKILGGAGAAGGGGLVASLGGVASAALPVVAGIAAVGAAGYGTYKALTAEVIPAIDLFATKLNTSIDPATGKMSYSLTKISETTKEKVGAMLESIKQAESDVTGMYIGVNRVSDESIGGLIKNANEMAAEINKASDEMAKKEIETLTGLFEKSNTLTAEKREQILKTVVDSHAKRKEATEKLRDELVGIYEEIREGTGEVTKEQHERISAILGELKEQSIRTMSENEAEQIAILDRLKFSTERINAEMVGDTIKKLEEQKREALKKAEENYKNQLRIAGELRKDGTKEANAAADEIIAAAERQYKEAVSSAEKLKSEGIEKLRDAYGELLDKVDHNSGKILTWWDKLKNWWESWWPSPKTATIDFQENHSISTKSIGSTPDAGIRSSGSGGVLDGHQAEPRRSGYGSSRKGGEQVMRHTGEVIVRGVNNRNETVAVVREVFRQEALSR